VNETRKHNHPGLCFEGSELCRLEETSEKHREAFLLWSKGQVVGNPAGERIAIPCVFRGGLVHPPAAPDNVKTYWKCDNGFGIVCECAQCNSACRGYSVADRFRVFDSANCWPEVPGVRFNPSIIVFEGKTLFAFRNRQWESEIWIGELGADYKPIGFANRVLIDHPKCRNGVDDPRFFVHLGKLHLAFVGVERSTGGVRTHMGYCRLDANRQAFEVTFPHYANRNALEKNWQFFSAGGDLYAVYSIAPHRVLRIAGSEIYTSHLTPTKAEWKGGELRGGASPILMNDRFYSWFHSSVKEGNAWVYNVGVYTFESSPPFRVTALTADPILWADRSTPGREKHVVFPCGAHVDLIGHKRWIVAGGRDDRFAELWDFDFEQVEELLSPIRRLPAVDNSAGESPGLADREVVWNSINGWSTDSKRRYLESYGASNRLLLAVEIGVWHGRVLAHLGALLAELRELDGLERLAVGIDPYEHAEQVQGCTDPAHVDWSVEVDWEQAHLMALANVRRHCPRSAVLWRMTSKQAASILPARIDLLHIDGCHSEQRSVEDVSLYLPLMSAGGVVILDDVDWSSVSRARQLLIDRCELMHDGGTWQAFRPI
jgi:predicted GH43/DUF377 family glycosyl hydrolase